MDILDTLVSTMFPLRGSSPGRRAGKRTGCAPPRAPRQWRGRTRTPPLAWRGRRRRSSSRSRTPAHRAKPRPSQPSALQIHPAALSVHTIALNVHPAALSVHTITLNVRPAALSVHTIGASPLRPGAERTQ
eukprot:6518754-Pyramimonas_sp.AAC.3